MLTDCRKNILVWSARQYFVSQHSAPMWNCNNYSLICNFSIKVSSPSRKERWHPSKSIKKVLILFPCSHIVLIVEVRSSSFQDHFYPTHLVLMQHRVGTQLRGLLIRHPYLWTKGQKTILWSRECLFLVFVLVWRGRILRSIFYLVFSTSLNFLPKKIRKEEKTMLALSQETFNFNGPGLGL